MSKQPILTSEQVAAERIDTMCRVFSTADRTLARRPISVVTANHAGISAPAWNDGSKITFNQAHIGDVATVEDIVRINGLNYHELSHIFFTPRRSTSLVQQVQGEGLHGAFNALEDQRIETLFTARFSGTTPYFVSIIMSYILDKPESWPHVFPLLHGRRYIDPVVRQDMEARFERPQNVKRLREVIDQYRLIANPEQDVRATIALIREYAALCETAPKHDPFGHATRSVQVQHGEPVNGAEQAEAVRQSIEQEGAQDAPGKQQQGVAQGSQEDAAGQQPGDGSQGAADGQDGSGNGQGDQGDREGQSGGHGIGTQPGGSHLSNKDLTDWAQQAINQVLNNPDVMRDVRDKQRTIVKGDGKTLPRLDARASRPAHPTAQDTNVVRKFYRELERLARDLVPGLLTHRSSGRINVKRVMQGAPRDEVFDEWQEGRNESAQMEVVVLLDYSGSMDNRMRDASTVLWTIKRAVEMVGRETSVTCIGFDTHATLLYGSQERAEANAIRVFASQGGTNPKDALEEAARIFHNTRRANRVLMLVTDGMFPNEHNDSLIERFNAAGVLTGMVFLGMSGMTTAHEWWQKRWHGDPDRQEMAQDEWDSMRHQCTVFSAMDSTSDLIPFAKALVKQAMRNSR